MKDPSDTRDIGPRIGSPLWIYLTVVTVAGLGTLLAALLRGLPARSPRPPPRMRRPANHRADNAVRPPQGRP